jgi:hypothetical protein
MTRWRKETHRTLANRCAWPEVSKSGAVQRRSRDSMRLRNKIGWRRGRAEKRRTSVNVKSDSFFSFSGARVGSLPFGLESLPGSLSDNPFSGQFSCSGLEGIEL